MVHVLLDICIYGRFFEDADGLHLAEEIIKDEKFIIHNFRLIRDELRNTSVKKAIRSKNLRVQMINLYDKLVKGRIIVEDKAIKSLAKEYFSEYKKQGGNLGQKSIINDLKISACAALKGIDILYSEDNKSLKSVNALAAYNIVNLKHNLRTPNFIGYSTLKKSKLQLF
ncbi:MAG: hypothetical protein PHO02_01525 [Candidatus Nanoarchaeia archaeon]|nr:hypothetical protein [Candidatus Nanoarchaeia archaeon]